MCPSRPELSQEAMLCFTCFASHEHRNCLRVTSLPEKHKNMFLSRSRARSSKHSKLVDRSGSFSCAVGKLEVKEMHHVLVPVGTPLKD